MAASDRRQVQQQLKQPDPFFETIIDAREYFDANRAKVLGIVGGGAALLVTVVAVSSYYMSQSESAATNFANAVTNLEAESMSAAEVDLQAVARTSNAGPYKALAALYRGNIARDAGRYEEAVVSYDEFLSDAPTDYLRQVGLVGKAAALEQSGKAADAATTLDQAAAIAGPYRKAALSDRARLAEVAGDKAAATTNLQKLLEIEGSGPGASEVERRIQALKQ